MFNQEQIESVEQELRKIKEDFYNVGEVSDLMKEMVVSVYGDEDWSTSGYWIRAEEIVNRHKKN